ncbi:MAG: HipA domain-containing protein [Granulosicoccus sp.]
MSVRSCTRASVYIGIGDVIRQISSQPVEDLHELWRRIAFTILVSNTDDHLKNHGFIYVGNEQWQWSPAFDINPSPSHHRVLETGIVQCGSFDASLDNAIEACELFDMALSNVESRSEALLGALALVGFRQMSF